MPGTFFGFNTALRGMQAQQRGIYTTSHNIANANTDGYTRQRVVLAPTLAYPVPALNHPGGTGWQIGTGVDSQETTRLRDAFLDTQIRRETGSLGQWEQMQDVLKQVEVVFNEPSDTGLSTLMSQFWASWQELAKYAESSPVRTTVVETANALAEAFRHSATQLTQIKDDIDQTIDLKVKEVNSLAQQIANLNGQIKNIVAAGDQPNDLLDQRDLLLDQLSKIIDFTVKENVGADGKADGTIQVLVSNIDITAVGSDNKIINTFSTSIDIDDNVQLKLGASPVSVTFDRGEIRGLLQGRSNVKTYLANLDKLATDLATTINTKHMGGWGIGDTAAQNRPFFVDGDNSTDNITASSIYINQDLIDHPMHIAAASPPTPPLTTVAPGDGSNALAIARLQHELIPDLSSTTFDDYYKNFTAKLGVDAHEAVRMTTNQGVLVDQLTNRKESISGVSLDEEMANMLQYQRAYEASARMITTLDGMLDKIINGMGVTR
ncbi:flagellar hook-associated protein FlgK [Moorella sp. Hama-1]|uniref:flagellar hook-associated protein FlgK n=1 Tax=Moorella sp. Hama-1 TaxID=2138101 RepID=UPI000D65B683|nr:flagellar hook-associated protein FlgK [Moorella sp. Hama-1]BCV20775.1 flagellar hook-associated protein 1 [Moorella sp. Hama-1]